jgi:hypothetical protein
MNVKQTIADFGKNKPGLFNRYLHEQTGLKIVYTVISGIEMY